MVENTLTHPRPSKAKHHAKKAYVALAMRQKAKAGKLPRYHIVAAQRVPTEPTPEEIAAAEKMARDFFDPVAAAVAHAAYLRRQQPA